MSGESHEPELAALAQALAGLAPTAGRLDRDELLFRAGQAALRRRAWLWPSVAAGLALLAGTFSLSEVLRPAPQRVQCIIYQRLEPPVDSWVDKQSVAQDAARPSSAEPERHAAPLSYLRLERLVLAWGVDALPNPRAAASSGEQDSRLSALPDILSRNRWFRMQKP
jgi:hypothetical protein